ncbi:MAG: hypothetical protein U1F55_06130 [Chitinivorax sp.]
MPLLTEQGIVWHDADFLQSIRLRVFDFRLLCQLRRQLVGAKFTRHTCMRGPSSQLLRILTTAIRAMLLCPIRRQRLFHRQRRVTAQFNNNARLGLRYRRQCH